MALEFKLIIDDKGTATIKKFRDTSNKAISDIEKKSAQSVKNQEKRYKRLGESLRKYRSVAFGALAAAGVGGMLANLASEAEETQSKFNVVFGNLARETNAWAESFGQSVGRARTDIKGWMAELQDTFVPLGNTRKAASEFSKSIVTLAVDVASFNNKADADVIRDFTSAIVGNHETVRKYGVIISEATLQQEALASGLIKTKRQLTAQEKVQARVNLLFKYTKDAQGDVIRTADSYANRVKRLRSEARDLGEDLGKFLIPAFSQLVEWAGKGIEAVEKFLKTIDVTTEEAQIKRTLDAAIKANARIEELINSRKEVAISADKEEEASAVQKFLNIGRGLHLAYIDAYQSIRGEVEPIYNYLFDEQQAINIEMSKMGPIAGMARAEFESLVNTDKEFAKSIASGNIPLEMQKESLTALIERLEKRLSLVKETNAEEGKAGAGIGGIDPEAVKAYADQIVRSANAALDMKGGLIESSEYIDTLAETDISPEDNIWDNYKDGIQQALSDQQIMVDLVGSLAQGITGPITAGLTDMIKGTKTISEGFKAIGTSILQNVVSALTEAIIKATIFKAVFGFFGVPFFGSGGTVGFGQLVPAGVPMAKKGGVLVSGLPAPAGIPKFGSGGIVEFGQLAPTGFPKFGIGETVGFNQLAPVDVPKFGIGGYGIGGRTIPGSDEVLVGIQPGEGVLTRRTVQRLGGPEGVDALNRGATTSGGNTINITINTKTVDENFVRRRLVPMLKDLDLNQRVSIA